MPFKNKQCFSDLSSLVFYSFVHFVVDFCCAFLLFRLYTIEAISVERVGFLFLVYNVLAFGLETFIGAFFNMKTARICASLGCVFLALALGIGFYVDCLIETLKVTCQETQLYISGLHSVENSGELLSCVKKIKIYPTTAIVLSGIGNAFFHVGGGIDVLSRNIEKCWRGGVFLSTGALGLAWGGVLGRGQSWSFEGIIGLLTFATFLVWFGCRHNDCSISTTIEYDNECHRSTSRVIHERNQSLCVSSFSIVTLCSILLVVIIRSFTGFVVPELYATRTTAMISPLFIAYASFIGKFIGGFGADILGKRLIGTSALVLAIPTLCFVNDPLFFLIGVLLLNISTAITLQLVVRICYKRVGFAFGLTTFALIIGYFAYDAIRSIIDWSSLFTVLNIIVVLSLLVSSLILFYVTSKKH